MKYDICPYFKDTRNDVYEQIDDDSYSQCNEHKDEHNTRYHQLIVHGHSQEKCIPGGKILPYNKTRRSPYIEAINTSSIEAIMKQQWYIKFAITVDQELDVRNHKGSRILKELLSKHNWHSIIPNHQQ